ncbi:ATP-binding protein [Sulfurimonas sp. HSL-1716]|uniref:AAA family ATPase n=1 Tax=Hydrocurvibacter sulfurireducens TaxID=3131937 RepID=UPI0031F7F8E1
MNKLHFLCGKMAAGKSTLSKKLAEKHDALLLCEDTMLEKLYPAEITTIHDYLKYSQRLKELLKEHIVELLKKGNDIVLDFPANTKNQRAWFREIFESANVEHVLHFVDKSDDVCKAQLRKRNENLPKDAPLTSEETFDAITGYFEAPGNAEGFCIQIYS